ncbi:uncharacterized protein LOC122506273 [Leptopilina heterotoma]|uniref:uncharacterized protein LOC122506273 n=1 Tax=Leptopilina heterotoma TaxID=63436 RepID=UPI001CAA0A17|nr:uncharacterized protein LOC122506273 [Leptopilina heterotoma]
MKRIRAGPTETEFATPSLPKNSKQKDFSDTRSPGSTNDLLLNEIRIAKSAIENPISEDSTLRSPKNSIQSDFRSKTFTSNLLPKKIPTDASTIKDSNSDESSTDTDEFAKPGLLENSKHKGFKTKDVFAPSTSTEKMRSLNNFNTASALPDNDNNPNASKSKFSSNLENALASLEYQDSKTGLSSDELILSKLNEIILLLRNMKIQSQSSCGTSNNRSFFDSTKCPKLPINSRKDLIATNDKLNDKNFKTKMINALGSIGGRDVNNVVANVCSKLFTNKLALLYSWSGRKSKLPLINTNFANLIIESVKVSCPKEDDYAIQIIVSKWFAQAKTRLKRELAKEGDEEDDNGEEEESLRDSDADDEEN